MPVIKHCPICMSDCSIHFDSEKNLYILECLNCKAKNITIRLENKDYNELLNLWNNRTMEKYILDYPEEAVMYLKLLHGEKIDIEKVKKVLTDFDYKKIEVDPVSIFGYLEDQSGKIFVCEKSHIDTLLDSLGLENIPSTNQTTLDEIIQNIFLKQGYIKISTQAKCMMLEINTEKVNKIQIDNLIEFISQPKNMRNIKVYYLDLFDNDENCKLEVFYNINDLILFLDKSI